MAQTALSILYPPSSPWLPRLHALDQDAGRLRPHHARVGQDARTQLLAQLPPADRHLLVAPGGTLVYQAHPADFFVVSREPHLDGLDEQLALQLVELALGGQAVPDVLAVLER